MTNYRVRNYREYQTIEKKSWSRGIWDSEPDKCQWIDAETDLDCLIVRNHFGALCGYCGVPPGHPFYDHSYNDLDIRVHGGLTYAAFCAETEDPSHNICHIPAAGRPDKVWWFGFDCAHGGDLYPAMPSDFIYPDDTYRTLAYVMGQIKNLARQLKDLDCCGTAVQ